MFFNDVAQGGALLIESAARYNAINELLRNGEEKIPGAVEIFDRQTVLFVNNSTQTIPAFSAVAVIGSFAGEEDIGREFSRQAGDCIVLGVPAVDESRFWGVAQNETLPGESGVMTIAGLTAAEFTGNGRFVAPSAAGLTAGDSGRGAVMLMPENSGSSWKIPGMIVLGGAGNAAAPANEYSGHFKLRALSADAVEIFSGVVPEADFSGWTDVPGLEYIPRTQLAGLGGSAKNIYLQFFYDRGNEVYSAEFCTFTSPDAVFYKLIGRFDNGGITQIYTGDDQMKFSDDWFLK